jgi:hypothetical protein
MITFKILDPVHTETNMEGKANLNKELSYQAYYWHQKRGAGYGKKRVDYPVYMIQSLSNSSHIFLTGLLPRAMNFLDNLKMPYELIGESPKIEYGSPNIPGLTYRPDQKRLIKAALENGRGVLQAPCGSGKCHGKDTPIIMFDGSIKMVQDVRPGDSLMGPDSEPRKVLSASIGRGPMYMVTPIKGEAFTCNGDHILSLQCMSTMGKGVTYKKDRVTNISIEEYLKQTKTFKSMMKLWRTGVDFPEKGLPVDPYMVGIYLGDGKRYNGASITTGNQDPEVGEYIECWAKANKFRVRKEQGGGCATRFIVRTKGKDNWFRNFVKKLVTPEGERTIPKQYLFNSRETRLKLLAGLIDTDGSYHKGYEITFKDRHFADQVVFLARSLGFAANISKKKATIKSLNFEGAYWRINLSGNLDEIPCKVARKKATPRRQIKNHLRTGFSIESIGQGDYYGFTLSGDGLYLLGDFTVTHNTVVLLGITAAFNEENILFLCHNVTLVSQFREELIKWGFNPKEIGVLSGSQNTTGRIQLASIQSFQKLKPRDYVNKYQVILVDECFHKSTKIKTSAGSRPIGEINIGDQVWTSMGLKGVNQVFKTKIPLEDIVKVKLSNNKVIFCSKNHLFKVKGGWVEAQNLKGKLLTTIKRYCPICGGLIQHAGNKYCSRACSYKDPKTTEPKKKGKTDE